MTENNIWGNKTLIPTPGALARINEQRAAHLLTDKINEVLGWQLDACLFELNTPLDVKAAMGHYLEQVKERKGISNYTVDARMATWEDYYPAMPERLLAIEAIEHRGLPARLDDSTGVLPPELVGYPYRRETSWLAESILPADHEDHWREWFFDYSQIPDEDGSFTVVEHHEWVIKDPEGIMLVDTHYTLARPINYITFDLVAGPGGFTLGEAPGDAAPPI